MTRKSNLISETTMYSINPKGEVVTHHLPWARTSPQLELYTAKGFTFERPLKPYLSKNIVEAEDTAGFRQLVAASLAVRDKVSCEYPFCGFIAKSEFGLMAHQRKHK